MRSEHTSSKTSPKLKTPGAKVPGKEAEIPGKEAEIPGKTAEIPGKTAEISWQKAGFKNSALEGLEHISQPLCECHEFRSRMSDLEM